jgi:hypothetical protein
MYEKDRIEIESRYAFLRCLESQNETENNKIIGLPTDKRRRKMNKSNISTTLESYSENLIEESKLEQQDARRNKVYPRTIQEFSYFDWSKVKLYENKFKDDENRPSTNLQMLNKAIDNDDDESFIQQQEKMKLNKINELSQVITIRFQ